MADIALKVDDAGLQRNFLSLRWRVVLTLFAVVSAIFVASSALIYAEAEEHRHELTHRALETAVATSTALDRDVAAVASLLKGLSQSPALRAGDYETFYNQLVETPRPQGSWFVLWGMDRQILNTIRPFGTRLPTFQEAGVQETNVNRLRDRGITVSDLVKGPVARVPAIGVHLRLNDPNGRMTGFLTASLPLERLQELAREVSMPAGWNTTVLDRTLTPVVSSGAGKEDAVRQIVPVLKERLAQQPASGHFRAQVGAEKVRVATHRSPMTDYTTITVLPQSVANAPVDDALWKIGSAGVALLLSGGLAGLLVMRQVAPVERSAATTARRLRLAEARYASLWSDTPESLFVVTVREDGRFIFEGLNPAHERATGLSFEAIAGKEVEECLPPETAAAVLERYRHCVAAGKPHIYDEVLDLPTGRRHWQTSLSPVRDPDTGRIILLVGTARDVTENREVQARIEHSQKLLQATLDALSAHIAILDERGTIIAVNNAWRRFAASGGYQTPDHGIGRNYPAICRDAARSDREVAAILTGLTRVLDGRDTFFEASYQCGSRSFRVFMARFCFAGATHVVVAHEDITDLRAAQQDARDLAERLLSLQEEERQRIARDLHDSTAQHLVAAALGLMNVSAVAGPEAEHAVDKVRGSLDEAQKEIRTLSYLLYPPELTRQGLASSLEFFIEGFSKRTGLQAQATIDPSVDRLPIDVQRSILRVVQEALSNVHRHACATAVQVSAAFENASLCLTLKDDGRGFAAEDGRPPKLGVGIPGMQARIRQFNGVLTVDSASGSTTVRAVIPLDEIKGRVSWPAPMHSQGFP